MSIQWNEALTGFMQNLGIGNFKANDMKGPKVNNIIIGDGRYVLDIEEIGDARGIILALFRKVPEHELYDKTKRILTACHCDKFLPIIVQVGLKSNDTLVLMVRVEQADGQVLSRAFDLMYKLYTDLDI